MFGAAGSVARVAPTSSKPIIVLDFDGVLSPVNFVSNRSAIRDTIFKKGTVDAKAAMNKIADRLLSLKSHYDLYICSQNYIGNLRKYKDFFHIDQIIGAKTLNGSVDKGVEVAVLNNSTTGHVYFFDDSPPEIESVRSQTIATATLVKRWYGTEKPDILEKLDSLESARQSLDFSSPNLRF